MFSVMQVVLLTTWMFIISFDWYHTQIFTYGRAVVSGFVAGVIMHNVQLGLLVGGTMELMSLGVGGYGGSSVPNYNIGAVVGVAFAALGNGEMDQALAIGIPVAALGVQLDVLAKMLGSVILHRAQALIEKYEFIKAEKVILLGVLPRAGFAALAVLLATTLGANAIEAIITNMPEFLTKGLLVASNVLPAVGFAILLRYMPLKEYFVYAIVGFVLATYFNTPIIGIALIGFVIAYIIYKNESSKVGVQTAVEGDNYDE